MSPDEGPWLVVGLGNPGEQYAGNRHNAGYLVADRLAALVGGRFRAHQARAQVIEGRLPATGGQPGERLVLAKPASYMNESGGPVAGLLNFYRLGRDRLLVVHDELDLPFGELRLKWGGGEGGHNGLRSLSRSVGGNDYGRVRLGIGRPPGRMDPADYVLRDVPAAQRAEFDILVMAAADAVEAVIRTGFLLTQAQIHAKSSSR